MCGGMTTGAPPKAERDDNDDASSTTPALSI
jgi:hypothetical protein